MSTTHLYVMPKLRMSGALLLLPLFAFMVGTETTLLFFYDPISRRCTVLYTDSGVKVRYKSIRVAGVLHVTPKWKKST